jgi:hypothetical protein
MSKMSVTEQARYALTWQLAEENQPPEVQAEMARLQAEGCRTTPAQAAPVPPAVTAEQRAERKAARSRFITNLIRSGWLWLLLPFAIVALAVPGARLVGVLLLLACLIGLGYYLLPWEVWLSRAADRDNGSQNGQR